MQCKQYLKKVIFPHNSNLDKCIVSMGLTMSITLRRNISMLNFCIKESIMKNNIENKSPMPASQDK